MISNVSTRYFPFLPLVYAASVAVLPRAAVLPLMTFWTAAFAVLEFLRIRRPELNARVLDEWHGFYSTSEILSPSWFFWIALGCWAAMTVFIGNKIILMAIGFVAVGDPAAVWGGRRWGRRPWPRNRAKTIEGAACFGAACIVWGLVVARLHWPVALLGAAAGAAIEAESWKWPTPVVLPLLGGFVLSVLNLVLGRGG